MPRVPRTGDQKAQYYLNKFPGEFALRPNGYLDCLLCLCTIKANKFSNLVSHRAGKKHTRLLNQRDTETARLEFMLNDDAPPPDDTIFLYFSVFDSHVNRYEWFSYLSYKYNHNIYFFFRNPIYFDWRWPLYGILSFKWEGGKSVSIGWHPLQKTKKWAHSETVRFNELRTTIRKHSSSETSQDF